MSDSGLEALEAERAVEAKLAEAGADQIRRHSFSDAPEAAPAEPGTPAEEITEQPRDEQGRFASAEPDVAPEAVAEDAPEQQVEADAPDPVDAFLAKFGGDREKAIKAAAHQTDLVGRQGQELGELRTQNAEYQQMIAELQAIREAVSTPQQPQVVDQATVDWYDQQVLTNPQAAVEWARQQGNTLLVQRGLDTWKDVDPYGAAVYTNNLNNAAYQQQLEQRLQQVQQLPVDASINLALSNVRSRNPQFVNYDDVIGSTIDRYPFAAKTLERAAATGDSSQLEGAIETLYALAQRDTLASLVLTGDTPETTTAVEQVVTPTTSETREPAPEPTPLDEFRQQFREIAERERKGIWVAD